MGPQFSHLLAYHDKTVIAMGPLGQDDDPPMPDYVEQMQAWIYQEVDLAKDAVAIPTTSVDEPVLQRAGVCWMLPLQAITATTQAFQEGRAFAVAIAMFSNKSKEPVFNRIGDKAGHVIWWGHPVHLLHSPQAVEMAMEEYKDDPGTAFAAITGILDGLWEQRQVAAG